MNVSEVKQQLNIDFPDQDDYLSLLMQSAFNRAKNITGLELDLLTVDAEYPEIYGAIMDDIAAQYQGRGEEVSGSKSAFSVYRRYSTRPML